MFAFKELHLHTNPNVRLDGMWLATGLAWDSDIWTRKVTDCRQLECRWTLSNKVKDKSIPDHLYCHLPQNYVPESEPCGDLVVLLIGEVTPHNFSTTCPPLTLSLPLSHSLSETFRRLTSFDRFRRIQPKFRQGLVKSYAACTTSEPISSLISPSVLRLPERLGNTVTVCRKQGNEISTFIESIEYSNREGWLNRWLWNSSRCKRSGTCGTEKELSS